MVQEQISKNSSIKVWSSWTEERHLGNTTNNGKHTVKSLMMIAHQLKLQNCLTSRTSSKKSVTKKKLASFQKVRKPPPVNPFLPARENRHSPQVLSRTRKHKEASRGNRRTWKEKQRQLQQTIQSQIQPTNEDHVPDPADNSAEPPVNIMRFDSSHACRAEQPEYLGRDEAT